MENGKMEKWKNGKKKKKKKKIPSTTRQPATTAAHASHTGEDEAVGSSDRRECRPTCPWAVIPECAVIGEPVIWNLESFEFLVVSRFGLDHHEDPYRPGKYTAGGVVYGENILRHTYGIQNS